MTDAFTQYERGLSQLLEQLGKDHPKYAEVLILQIRLQENIAQARRYGDTETHRTERAQIVDALNRLVLGALGTSFNELCNLLPDVPLAQQDSKASSVSLPVERKQPMRNRRLVFAFILSAILSLLVGLLSNLAATYLAPNLAGQPWLVYSVLIVTFIIALPVSIYLFLRSLPETEVPPRVTAPPPVVPQLPTQRVDPSPSLTNQLPGKSYRELVGRDVLVGEVMAALRDPAGKWTVAIDGMGGIGKTALAREVADRCLAEHLFDVVVWEQAPKEQLATGDRGRGVGTLTYETALDSIARQLGVLDVPRLKGTEKETRIRALLQTQRVLVVLDNMETAKEPQNEIARQLQPLLGPSKALLTSRHRFKGDLYTIHLTGLDEDNALRLIRQEAEEKRISRVAAARQSELKEIAQSTGGSPLALKLVVGQLGHLPLDLVLGQLREVRLPDDESDEGDYIRFYKGIFFPSWRLLSNDGKKLLISMAHFAPGIGGTLEAVKATSDLADDVLTGCIDELWRLSFLEVGESPSLKKVRYYLHTLTQYFILSDIVQVLK
ncbi:MAG: NB-ARC domain-containing protein [Nitrososphaera sp.]|nr:NB-ARC domain-containing protein [Nitrososphaera sp.]